MNKKRDFWIGTFWIALFWLLYALISGWAVIYKYPDLIGYTINLKIGQFLLYTLTSASMFILFKRHIYFEPDRTRQIFRVLTAWLIVGALLQALVMSYDYLVLCNDRIPVSQFLVYWANTLLTLVPMVALFYVLKFLHLRNEAERKKAEAISLAREARLQLLTYQLNPHFLFNALNTIMALIDINKDEAREIVADLSEYLRYSLSSASKSTVTMAEEYQSVLDYLKIQKKRFKDKITINTTIDEASKPIRVPVFIIHPLIDNAIKHGSKSSKDILKVELSIEAVADGIRVLVRNSGQLRSDSSPDKANTGTGLSNTRSRLALLYGEDFGLTLTADETGVKATMMLGILT